MVRVKDIEKNCQRKRYLDTEIHRERYERKRPKQEKKIKMEKAMIFKIRKTKTHRDVQRFPHVRGTCTGTFVREDTCKF